MPMRDPSISTLKARTLELFTHHSVLRPEEWARLVGFYPMRASWSYLRRQWKIGNLRRSRDWKGRIQYSISRRGAQWLLWWKANGWDVKVRSS